MLVNVLEYATYGDIEGCDLGKVEDRIMLLPASCYCQHHIIVQGQYGNTNKAPR